MVHVVLASYNLRTVFTLKVDYNSVAALFAVSQLGNIDNLCLNIFGEALPFSVHLSNPRVTFADTALFAITKWTYPISKNGVILHSFVGYILIISYLVYAERKTQPFVLLMLPEKTRIREQLHALIHLMIQSQRVLCRETARQ